MVDPSARPRRARSDVTHNRAHILEAAGRLLSRRPRATMSEVAVEANVSRGTLYRHFATRGDLLDAINRAAYEGAVASVGEGLLPAGQLARAVPTPLSVADVLNKVPPHLLGDQIVAEAQRIGGVSSAAIYLVDLDGAMLKRLAGPHSFPLEVPVPFAVGTEIPIEGLPALQGAIEQHLPGAASSPLLLRGRALGTLVAVGAPADALHDLAYEAAAALVVAGTYTDSLDAARRVRATSPAAEIQQNLLPPRVVRTSGAMIAGNVLPGYEIGGDWFDYVENTDRTWVGIADAMGNGTRAAALASVALGAFRSARHQQLELEEVVELMDRTVRELGTGNTVTTTIGHWVAPTSTFSWITCGELGPIVIGSDGYGETMDPVSVPALGADGGLGELTARSRRLQDGELLLLASDGIIDRASPETGALTIDGVVRAVREGPFRSAAGALASVEERVRSLSEDPLEDDATIVVLAPVLSPGG